MVLCASLLLLAVYWSPLSVVLQTQDPQFDGWLLILGMSLIPAGLGIFVPGIHFTTASRDTNQRGIAT